MKEAFSEISPTNRLIRSSVNEQASSDPEIAQKILKFFAVEREIDSKTDDFTRRLNTNKSRSDQINAEQARHLLEDAFWVRQSEDFFEMAQFQNEWGRLAPVGLSSVDIIVRDVEEKLNGRELHEKQIKALDKKARKALPRLNIAQKRRLLTISGFSNDVVDEIVSIIPESAEWTFKVEGFKELATVASSVLLAGYLREQYGDMPAVNAMLLGDAVYYSSQALLNLELMRVLDKTGNAPNVFIVSADIYTKNQKPVPRFLTKMVAGFMTEGVKELGWRAYALSPVKIGPLESELVYLVGSFVNAGLNLAEIVMLEVYVQTNKHSEKNA